MLEPGGLFRLDLLHATVFLSMLAARSDLAQGLELLHDKSPLHELVHMQPVSIIQTMKNSLSTLKIG
jgi:hypothetical protein